MGKVKKSAANSDYADVNPGDLDEAMKVLGGGVKKTAEIGAQAVEGGKIIAGRLNSLIHGPTKAEKQAAELQKLQSEVNELEAQKKIDAQIEELRKKKQALTQVPSESEEESENEDEHVAFA